MKILLISIVFALNIWLSQGQNKFVTCNRYWTKIGCFNDKIKPSRPLPEMLLNDRDKNSKYHESGHVLDWHKWPESIHSLVCRCAEIARQKGYNVFGIQFYGECWSGPFAEFNYTRDGQADVDKCIMSLYKPTDCVQDEDQECVGLQHTNYIYKLTENPGPQSPDVDGGYTPWSQWTQCSKTCESGEKSRERTCTNPVPKGNGKSCDRLGEPEETAKCNNQDCDVDGGYTPWSQWSQCSKTCGSGEKSRERTCTNPVPKGNGKSCDRLGEPEETAKCNNQDCDVDGGYTPWSQWSQCSKTCGSGEKSRERTCTNPTPKGNGKSCDRLGEPKETAKCNTQDCDVDGGYTPWSQWSNCSEPCGMGQRSRERTCTNPVPKGNGKSCDQLGQSASETQKCFKECNDCDKKMDICLIIDSSSSVRRDNYEKVKDYLIDFVEKLHVSDSDTHVCFIHYNHKVFLDWDLQSDLAKDPKKLKVAIKEVKYQPGGTRTDKALEESNAVFEKNRGERSDALRVVFIITDGRTNSGSKKYKDVLIPLQAKGVKIFVVGVGRRVGKKELMEITGGKEDNVIKFDKFEDILSHFNVTVETFCKAKKLLSQPH